MAEPLPICYVNGEFLPFEAARISPFDRGFLFGDGAYEVMPVYAGRPFRAAAHCERLTRSLAAIRMEDPHTSVEWRALFAALGFRYTNEVLHCGQVPSGCRPLRRTSLM